MMFHMQRHDAITERIKALVCPEVSALPRAGGLTIANSQPEKTPALAGVFSVARYLDLAFSPAVSGAFDFFAFFFFI
jgi:hypothetical protein